MAMTLEIHSDLFERTRLSNMAVEQIIEGTSFTSPLVLPLITILVALAAIHFWQQSRRDRKIGDMIPGPPTVPIIGNAHYFVNLKTDEIFEKAMSISNVYGHVIRGWIGHKLAVFLSDPRDAELILSSHVHIDKSDEYRYFKPWLGNGLLISTGEKWRTHRKLIAPAFHMNVLKSFMPTFNDNARFVVSKLKKEVGKEFDCHDYMSEATVDILLETAMGSRRTSEDEEGFRYAMAVMKMCEILHKRQLQVFSRYEPFFTMSGMRKQQKKLLGIIHGMTQRVLNEKKAVFDKNLEEGNLPSPSLQDIIKVNEEVDQAIRKAKAKANKVTGLRDDLDDIDENDIGEKRRLAFLDLMIETSHFNPNQLSNEEIKQQVDTIMFEGHDTTAAGSSFTLCMLGVHQDIQEKVMKEQKAIFGNSTRDITFADTTEMKYLERVILETLRLYPPVPIIARKINTDLKLVSQDLVIPAGATVVIGTFRIHRRPDIYNNPEKFDPDNFLPERTQHRHYYSYIPFSAGPRSCVGRKYAMLKLKVLLSTILRNFHIKSTVPEKDFKLQADIILKRTDGFRIWLEPQMYREAMNVADTYGYVFRVWIGHKLAVFLSDPRDAELILGSHVHIDKSDEYRYFKPWLGNGLLISTGEKWRTHRKLIAPAFHMNVLKSFMPTFNDNARFVVSKLKKEVGKEFDCHDYMSEATVDILLETAMGSRRTSEDEEGFRYAMAVMKMCEILHKRQLQVFSRYEPFFTMSGMRKQQKKLLGIIHGMTQRVLNEKKAVFDKNLEEGNLPSPSLQDIIKVNEEVDQAIRKAKAKANKVTGLRDDLDDIDENDIGEKRRLAFLDLMIETSHFNPNQLSNEEIKQQVDTIMFEGHDTTAAGSSFTLCMLGVHQDIQEKVMKEQKAIFGNSTRDITFADTTEMKYLERVILETLRLYPPVPIIARKINTDLKLASQDLIIPAGSTVVINTIIIHRRPDIYNNPEKFDPDNFLPERTQHRHYYSYIPFSAGPRSCVGRKYAMLKLKVLLSTILRNFHIKSTVPEKDFKLQADIILKRADGFRIWLEPRNVTNVME
ncbi:CLUMA_CG006508, isoform B [Clunio marinus]|uniref:CLUMA_CG006508, isoform B n=1 Tax=Clunio marinus TaxID=568069 RepID=A0A1J1I034_9DIPT|nr:CLUMA_CG006508, isoform B [Clunio marinus]